MARVPIVNESYVEGTYTTPANRYHSGNGSSSSAAHSRDTQLNNSISEQVMNSPAYKSAYNVLSQESDKSWLQRLEMIPYSVSDASSTFLDDWGLSNNFNDKQDANYQYCMEQISALMAEYQSWKNSLPITQTQQMADAGINSAITGQGVNSSSVPNVGVSSNPSNLQSTNVGQSIAQLGQFIISGVNGFASVAQQFKQLGLSTRSQQFSEDSAFMNFVTYAREHGITLPANVDNWSTLVEYYYGIKRNDPEGDFIRSNNILKKWLAHHKNAPIMATLASKYPDVIETHNFGDGTYVSDGIASYPVGIDAYADLLLKLYREEESWRLYNEKYTAEISKFDATSAEHNAKRAEHEKKHAEYEEKKMGYVNQYLNQLAKSDNIYDKVLVIKYLLNSTQFEVMGYDLDTQIKSKDIDWYDEKAGSEVYSNYTPI